MIRCQQKYCKYCVKPQFKDYKNYRDFMYGYCRMSKHLILNCVPEENQKMEGCLALYCEQYTQRKRKINY
jgi:hypothetical protein